MSLIAGLRQRRTLGEVSVELASQRHDGVVLREVAAALVTCVRALILDVDELGSQALKHDLDALRTMIESDGSADDLQRDAVKHQRETLELAERERRWLDDRDAELRHI